MLANNPSVLTGGGVATNVVNGTFQLIGPTGNIALTAQGTNQNITLTPSGTGFTQIGSASGTLLLVGTGTNSSNGAIQLATHTTSAGGIGFGTDWSFYRQDNNYFCLSTSSGGATALKLLRGSTAYGQLYFDAVESFVEPLVNIPFSIRIGSNPALTCDTSRNTSFFGIVIHKSYTVATLPAAAAANTYGTTFVSDATQLAGVGIGTAPTGGGAIKRAVYSTGAAWLLL